MAPKMLHNVLEVVSNNINNQINETISILNWKRSATIECPDYCLRV